MSPAGRRAALPSRGYRAVELLIVTDTECRVVFIAERDGARAEYDFAKFPGSWVMRRWFAAAFAAVSGPSGGIRTVNSARTARGRLKSFACYLDSLQRPPQSPAELKPVHWDGVLLTQRDATGVVKPLGSLRTLLRAAPQIPEEFLLRVNTTRLPQPAAPSPTCYTEGEFRRIASAARAQLRAAAERIWTGRDLLARWRAGDINRKTDYACWSQGRLLDHVDRHGDVPRYDRSDGTQAVSEPAKAQGGSRLLISRLHLLYDDVGAAATLLICLTGQNVSTLDTAPAGHHRPDGDAGATRTAVVDLVKPRRGRSQAEMSVTFGDTPVLDKSPTTPQAGSRPLDLRSPFGVYRLLVDLAGPARDRIGSDRLFVHYGFMGHCGRGFRPGLPRGVIPDWGTSLGLVADAAGEDRSPMPLAVDATRLRRTWLELHQRPVAQTERTLANEYLARDRGNLAEYQRVVARILDEQVTRARSMSLMRTITADELALAHTDPQTAADRHGLRIDVLKQVLAGELDTALGACTDNTHSPHAPPGKPCRASFLLCLTCPCARATPTHLPLLVGVHDRLLARRQEMQPLRWAQRFAGPVAQLAELLTRFGDHHPVANARADITAEQHALIERFLTQGLDLR